MFDRNPVMAMAGATDFGIDKLCKFSLGSDQRKYYILLTLSCLAFPKKGTLANTVDSVQMVQNTTSDQGLHCM